MDRSTHWAATVASLVLLAGCNAVVSTEPWFTEADAEGGPNLREGLWVMISDAPCRVDLEKPAERWPDCADPFYLRGHEWLAMQHGFDVSGRRAQVFEGWQSLPIVLAAGDPPILQLDEGSEPALASAPGEVAIGGDEIAWRYSYAAIRAAEVDGEGRVVAFDLWSVQCGPSPDREFEGGVEYEADTLTEGYVTERPFPGLTVVGQRCTAESAAALRQAAASSRELGNLAQVRWVRDGWR